MRDWIMSDLEIYSHWNTGSHLWMDYNGPYYPKMDEKELKVSLAKTRQRIEQSFFPEPRTELVVADRETDKMLGAVSWYWQSKETNWMSQGIVLYDDGFWGRGIGFEALGLWCEYLLKQFPELARLDLRSWSGNHGLMRLAEKLGFRKEACFRKARIVKGQFYDSVGYGLLREEWQERYPQGFIKKET